MIEREPSGAWIEMVSPLHQVEGLPNGLRTCHKVLLVVGPEPVFKVPFPIATKHFLHCFKCFAYARIAIIGLIAACIFVVGKEIILSCLLGFLCFVWILWSIEVAIAKVLVDCPADWSREVSERFIGYRESGVEACDLVSWFQCFVSFVRGLCGV